MNGWDLADAYKSNVNSIRNGKMNNYANILVQLDYEIIFENMGRLDIKDFFFEVGWKIKDDFAQSALQTPLR